MVHVSDIDFFVEHDEDIYAIDPISSDDPVVEKIGYNIAQLIEDGSCLQMGQGGVPNAILKFLGDKKDLGVHTEVFTDNLIPLIKAGVVNGKSPNIAKRMELENQLTQMKLLKRAHADQQRSIRFKIDMQLQPTVDNLEKLHGEAVDDEPKFHKAVEIRDQHLAQGVCGLDLGDGPITDRKQAIHDLVGIAHRLDHGQTMEVGEYCGLTVMVASKNMAVKGINAFRPFVGLKGEHEHWAGTSVPDINNSADNVIRQLDRIIANNADTAQGLRVRLDNAKANLESAWNALNTPWEGQQEYDDLTDQIAKMNLEIKNSQDTAPAGEDEQDTQADLAKAQAASVTVGFDPSEPSAFPTAAETTDIPMPDPCIDPSDDVSAGPGIGM